MKENELIFDRTKHVCYSEAVKQVITDCLKKANFLKKEADILWEKNPVENIPNIYRRSLIWAVQKTIIMLPAEPTTASLYLHITKC